MKKLLLYSFLGASVTAFAEKVLILTHVHSRPDLIEIQDKTFKAFLKDNYEFVVFNDAPTDALSTIMERTCKKLDIECIRVPQRLHEQRNKPSERHADGIQLSLNLKGYDHKGIVFLLDSDMFLIKPFSIIEYMKGYDIAGLEQQRSDDKNKISYLWPGVLFINMNTVPHKRTISLDCGQIHGVPVDTGGQLYHYLTANPSLKVKFTDATSTYWLPGDKAQLRKQGFDDSTIKFILKLKKDTQYTMEFHLQGNFLHYYAGGSNWVNLPPSFHQTKTKFLTDFISDIVS